MTFHDVADDLRQDHAGQHGAGQEHGPPGVLGEQAPGHGHDQDDDRQADGAEDNRKDDHDGGGGLAAQGHEPGADGLVCRRDAVVLEDARQDDHEQHETCDHQTDGGAVEVPARRLAHVSLLHDELLVEGPPPSLRFPCLSLCHVVMPPLRCVENNLPAEDYPRYLQGHRQAGRTELAGPNLIAAFAVKDAEVHFTAFAREATFICPSEETVWVGADETASRQISRAEGPGSGGTAGQGRTARPAPLSTSKPGPKGFDGPINMTLLFLQLLGPRRDLQERQCYDPRYPVH